MAVKKTTEKTTEKKPAEKAAVMKGVVKCPLNIRKEASLKAEIVGMLGHGETVKISGEEGDFYKIVSGYVNKEFVDVG